MPDPVSGAIGGSAVLGAISSNRAASTQANAANRAADLSNEQYQQTRADQAPYRQAGETALNQLIPLSTNYQKFGMDQFQQDPGYAFRLSEGQKALDRSAAARGGLISGGALKAAQRYGQDMGSQEYTNAFNRFQAERSARLNPLQSLAGIGQSATNFVGQAGANNANSMGGYLTGGAAAQAAGQIGMANAASSGLGTYMNYNQNQAQNSLLQQAIQNRGGGINYGSMLNPNGAGGSVTGTGAENYFSPY